MLELDPNVVIPALFTAVVALVTALLGFVAANVFKPRNDRETSFAEDARERLRDLEKEIRKLHKEIADSAIARVRLEDRVATLEQDKRRLEERVAILEEDKRRLQEENQALRAAQGSR